MEKIDFKRSLHLLYSATAEVSRVSPGEGVFLGVSGEGEPGSAAHSLAIKRIFELSWAVKLSLEYSGVLDYKVPPLECLWLSDPTLAPHAPWEWRLLQRLPERVTDAQIDGPRLYVAAKKKLETDDIRRVVFEEGHSIQTLHVGRYGEESAAYARLDAYAGENGFQTGPVGHDIYLSDPDQVSPQKLQTIIRLALLADG